MQSARPNMMALLTEPAALPILWGLFWVYGVLLHKIARKNIRQYRAL